MKYLLGILTTLLALCLATYFVLQLWDINPISSQHFQKTLVTLGIIAVLTVVLTIALPFFFKNHSAGYDKDSGNVAQSRKK